MSGWQSPQSLAEQADSLERQVGELRREAREKARIAGCVGSDGNPARYLPREGSSEVISLMDRANQLAAQARHLRGLALKYGGQPTVAPTRSGIGPARSVT